jgi:hypothetical protein
MEVLNQTSDNQPTLMRDIYESLIGENVHVYLNGGHHPLAGKLSSYNGYIIHLVGMYSIKNTYIPTDKIIAICSEK